MSCDKKHSNCVGKHTKLELHSISDIVSHYKKKYRKDVIKELRFYAQGSFSQAIENAAMCKKLNGKRHNHQRRIPKESLQKSNYKLQLQHYNIKKSQTFEQLHEFIKETIDPIYKIGPLTIYDIAQRIGIKLKLLPNLVFLHAGTALGAKYLVADCGPDTLELSQLPKEFRSLEPYEIEDCLCIYKNEIKKICQK